MNSSNEHRWRNIRWTGNSLLAIGLAGLITSSVFSSSNVYKSNRAQKRNDPTATATYSKKALDWMWGYIPSVILMLGGRVIGGSARWYAEEELNLKVHNERSGILARYTQ